LKYALEAERFASTLRNFRALVPVRMNLIPFVKPPVSQFKLPSDYSKFQEFFHLFALCRYLNSTPKKNQSVLDNFLQMIIFL
jgi:hypothetical protein